MNTYIKKALCLTLILALSAPIAATDNWKAWLTRKTAAIATGAVAAAGGLALLYNYMKKPSPEEILDKALADFETLEQLFEGSKNEDILDSALWELEVIDEAKATEDQFKEPFFKIQQASNEAHREYLKDIYYQKYVNEIESVKHRCLDYKGPVSKSVYFIAYQAAIDLEVYNVNFYLTNYKVSHATKGQFIGLTDYAVCPKTYMATAFGTEAIDLSSWITNLNRTLYHELTHIKFMHHTIQSRQIRINNAFEATNDEYFFGATNGESFNAIKQAAEIQPSDLLTGRTDEMEAELSAVFYLNKLKKCKYIWGGCVEDDEHPTSDEHERYINELLTRLEKNPSLTYAEVKKLKAIYRMEKISGKKAFVSCDRSECSSSPAASSSSC